MPNEKVVSIADLSAHARVLCAEHNLGACFIVCVKKDGQGEVGYWVTPEAMPEKVQNALCHAIALNREL